jgi:putative spermidine/putrescine transport system substrate-binding protein
MACVISRRDALSALSGLAAAYGTGVAAQTKAPVALNIIDVAGDLQLTQGGIERFVRDNQKLVSKVSFSRAPSPELPAKIKAQQQANKVDIDMVLTGRGALSDGIQQGLSLRR